MTANVSKTLYHTPLFKEYLARKWIAPTPPQSGNELKIYPLIKNGQSLPFSTVFKGPAITLKWKSKKIMITS